MDNPLLYLWFILHLFSIINFANETISNKHAIWWVLVETWRKTHACYSSLASIYYQLSVRLASIQLTVLREILTNEYRIKWPIRMPAAEPALFIRVVYIIGRYLCIFPDRSDKRILARPHRMVRATHRVLLYGIDRHWFSSRQAHPEHAERVIDRSLKRTKLENTTTNRDAKLYGGAHGAVCVGYLWAANRPTLVVRPAVVRRREVQLGTGSPPPQLLYHRPAS